MNASSAAAGSGISGGDMTDAPTALNAATAVTGAGMDFLEAMDTAGWSFAAAGPLREALVAYRADAQAELTEMIAGAAGAQHRNAGTYQEGRGGRTAHNTKALLFAHTESRADLVAVAAAAGLEISYLHKTKQDLHRAVLRHTVGDWITGASLLGSDPGGRRGPSANIFEPTEESTPTRRDQR